MSLIICKLPKTGIGNQLFPLTKAMLFGYFNNIPVVFTGYHQLKIGPYLRGDKSKRNYNGYFTFEKGVLSTFIDKFKLLKYMHYDVLRDPNISKLVNTNGKQLYIFNRLPHWSDYFYDLKEHRELVTGLLISHLTPPIRKKFDEGQPPVIGVHVRMGDFRKLKAGEDFGKLGVVRTPIEYFIKVITGIRNLNGSDLPVSIFTDGHKHELQQLLGLPNIQVIEGNPDIVDLLLLSKSRVIVTSAGSTFSYWGGFLSNAPLIIHPQHIYKTIRPALMAEKIYEGPFDVNNGLLADNIIRIPQELMVNHS